MMITSVTAVLALMSSQKSIVSTNIYHRDLINRLLSVYDELAKTHPKSLAIHRIPLDFCPEPAFRERADKFVRNYLRKCVPCLFSLLKALYKSRPELAPSVFGEIVQRRLNELANEPDSAEELAYTLYFKAQHEDKLDPGCEVSVFARIHKENDDEIYRPVPII